MRWSLQWCLTVPLSLNTDSLIGQSAIVIQSTKVVFMASITVIEWLRERTEHLDIFFFSPITQWCSISDVLFTGGRGVSDFSVLKILLGRLPKVDLII